MIGRIPFFAAYRPLKEALEPVWFVAAALRYLIVLRLLVKNVMKMIEARRRSDYPDG